MTVQLQMSYLIGSNAKNVTELYKTLQSKHLTVSFHTPAPLSFQGFCSILGNLKTLRKSHHSAERAREATKMLPLLIIFASNSTVGPT